MVVGRGSGLLIGSFLFRFAQVENRGPEAILTIATRVSITGNLLIDQCPNLAAPAQLSLLSNISGQCSGLDVPEGAHVSISSTKCVTVSCSVFVQSGGRFEKDDGTDVVFLASFTNRGSARFGSGQSLFISPVGRELPRQSAKCSMADTDLWLCR